MEIFPRDKVAGVFRGFREGGLEFHADLAIPYKPELHAIPMHGQFLLVQLESPEEAILGRITSFSSEGKLAMGSGEEFNIRAVRDGRAVPDDLREDYLKYRVNIRVLGVLRNGSGNRLDFVPSHRRLPHVGSPVAFPSDEVLKEVAGHNDDGAAIGHLAFGEYVYHPDLPGEARKSWMRLKAPEVKVRFPVKALISRRSFIFARAGFGKSNLNKLLFSTLYHTPPTVPKRGERQVPVGTLIFDPDGEYFWPDDKGRPGLCDVPHLEDKLVVFTSRDAPSPFYGSFTASKVRIDIRQLRPADVISIALAPERQEQQNVTKLRGLSSDSWRKLVDLIHADGNAADEQAVADLLKIQLPNQQAEVIAARSNMTRVVRMLHDPSSQFMGLVLQALEAGKLCVVDISQMRGEQGYVLAGIILRQIFSRNQEQFTQAEPKTIPTIAVIEEAQAVLSERAAASEPFISWVKEGRKYDLGAVLVTQQPGSIPDEILSQGDNWFVFHLLSAGDLGNVRKANAHFSTDLLSSLLNEPIVGQGVFWTSAKEDRVYPIPLRVGSFEAFYKTQDPSYSGSAIATFASTLRSQVEVLRREVISPTYGGAELPLSAEDTENGFDNSALEEHRALEGIRNNPGLCGRLRGEGALWGEVKGVIKDVLPKTTANTDDRAYHLVVPTMNAFFGGPQDSAWHTERRPTTKAPSKPQTWIVSGPKRQS